MFLQNYLSCFLKYCCIHLLYLNDEPVFTSSICSFTLYLRWTWWFTNTLVLLWSSIFCKTSMDEKSFLECAHFISSFNASTQWRSTCHWTFPVKFVKNKGIICKHSYILWQQYFTNMLRGNCTPNQNLACFVLYFKIINTFFWKMIYASYSKLSKELNYSIKM